MISLRIKPSHLTSTFFFTIPTYPLDWNCKTLYKGKSFKRKSIQQGNPDKPKRLNLTCTYICYFLDCQTTAKCSFRTVITLPTFIEGSLMGQSFIILIFHIKKGKAKRSNLPNVSCLLQDKAHAIFTEAWCFPKAKVRKARTPRTEETKVYSQRS